MNKGDLRAQFQSLLNRDDCSDAQANIFLENAMSRIQRVIRVPFMERMFQVTTALTDMPLTYVQIPPDYIELKDIYVTPPSAVDMMPLTQLPSMRKLLAISSSKEPTAYTRFGATFQIRGPVAPGSSVLVHYYGEISDWSDDTSENEVSASAPDVVLFGALSIAGEYFRHDQTPAWEGRYQAYLGELTSQGDDADGGDGNTVALAY
jgi:hypothetical protein